MNKHAPIPTVEEIGIEKYAEMAEKVKDYTLPQLIISYDRLTREVAELTEINNKYYGAMMGAYIKLKASAEFYGNADHDTAQKLSVNAWGILKEAIAKAENQP